MVISQQRRGAPAQRLQQLQRQVSLQRTSSLPGRPLPSHRCPAQVRELERLLGQPEARRPPPADAARVQALLELRAQRLEAQLQERHLEAKRRFQDMEQHFQTVKVEAAGSAADPPPPDRG